MDGREQKVRPSLLPLEPGLLEGSTFASTSCSLRHLRALLRIKMGQQHAEALSASGTGLEGLQDRGERGVLIGGSGHSSYVCPPFSC
jgi:hypothetical protein